MSGLAGFVGSADPDCLEHMAGLLGAGDRAHDLWPPEAPVAGLVASGRTVRDGTLCFALAGELLDSGDTLERLPAAYRANPEGFSAALAGRFALAVRDEARGRVLLACDRTGAQSLFWTQVGGAVYFATAAKCLLGLPGVPRQLDELALDEFLAHGYTSGSRTLLAGVHRLPPGHELIVERGVVTVRPCAPAAAEEPTGDAVAHASRLGELLTDAITKRLASGGPTGCFLTGGVDSALVLALLREAGVSSVQTFAVDFAGAQGSADRDAARRVADAFGTDHHELETSAPSSLDLIELTWLIDMPVATPSVFATYVLSALAREHVGRAFSGQGASRLFGRRSGLREAPAAGGPGLVASLLARLPWLSRWHAHPDGERLALGSETLFDADARADLYAAELRLRLARRAAEEAEARAPGDPSPGSKPRALSRATRAQRLDLELPYLDHRLIAWAGSLSKDSETSRQKALGALREVARRRLPDWVLARAGAKRSLPIAAWLRGPLSSFTAVLLGEPYLKRQNVFDPASVRSLLARLRTGGPAAAAQVWRLLAFQLWYLIFIEDEERARQEIGKARQTDRIPIKPAGEFESRLDA